MPPEWRERVAISIVMNLEATFEQDEMNVLGDVNGTGYAIEDLPSDYLGHYAYIRLQACIRGWIERCNPAQRKRDLSLPSLIRVLDGQNAKLQAVRAGSEPVRCHYGLDGPELCNDKKNFSSYPRVFDPVTGHYINKPWPAYLMIDYTTQYWSVIDSNFFMGDSQLR